MPIVVEAGKPVGKAQVALMALLQRDKKGDLLDLKRDRSLLGVHYKKIMSAAKALAKKGLINYDGYNDVSLKGPTEHRLVPVSENVAKEIQSQIGRKALMMIGAKQLVDHGDGLSFRIGRNKLNANIVHVTYNKGKDDYTVEFKRQRGVDLKTLKAATGVYAEDLTRIIGDTTGLEVQMPVVQFKRNESVDEITQAELDKHPDIKQAVDAMIGWLKKKGVGWEKWDTDKKGRLVFTFKRTPSPEVMAALRKASGLEGKTIRDTFLSGSTFKVSLMQLQKTLKALGESVDETGVYAHPAQPPKYNPKKMRSEPAKGPWIVNIDLFNGADVEALMAAFDTDDETDWPMKKSLYGFGLQVTVDAPTRHDAEELVRSALVRFGWAEKEPPDMGLGAMAPPSAYPVNPMYTEAEEPKRGVKKSKDEVGYQTQPSNGGNRCADCAYVSLPSACKKVEGKIDQDGSCNLWKRGIAS